MEIIKNIGAIVGMALSAPHRSRYCASHCGKRSRVGFGQVSRAEEYWDAIERNQMAIDEILGQGCSR